METTDSYRRSLKRKNYSSQTVKTYMHIVTHFIRWLAIPLASVTRDAIGAYVDHLQRRHLAPKTITNYLQTIRLFFDYCINEEGMVMNNPVTKISIRLPKPLAPSPEGRPGCEPSCRHQKSHETGRCSW